MRSPKSSPAILSQTDETDSSDDEESFIKVYKVRWAVLLVASVAISMRGFNQSCFGIINNVYVRYFSVFPWQIDWFVVIQSVVFLLASLPMTLFIKRFSYKMSMCLISGSLTLGFAVTAFGMLDRSAGYTMILIGQGGMGFSNILSWSIAPATAAVWFPPNEVAIAVAVQVVARGIGESLGCIVPPLLVQETSTFSQVKFRLLGMFLVLIAIALVVFVICLLAVKARPDQPPSEAQAEALRVARHSQPADFRASLAEFRDTIKELFRSRTFISVWFVFGAVNPILRTSNILLSSMLNSSFHEQSAIDFQVGLVLLVAWSMYTVGGFIAGPVIAQTRRYKEIVLCNVIMLLVTALGLMLGIYFRKLIVVYCSIALQGLFLGMANTSLFELLIEVTFPQPAMFVTMIAIVMMGVFRLSYPIVGRIILTAAGSTVATSLPVVMMFVCCVIMLLLKPTYKREEANRMTEERILLSPKQNDR